LQVFSIAVFAGDRNLVYAKNFTSSLQPDVKEDVLRYLDNVNSTITANFKDRLVTNLYGAVIKVPLSLSLTTPPMSRNPQRRRCTQLDVESFVF
jgi:hypothetical protein